MGTIDPMRSASFPIWRLAAGLGFCLCAAGHAQAAPTTCSADEDVIFSCRTGQKVIAVCSARASKGSIEYRFGKPAHAELTIPARMGDPTAAGLSGATLAFSGGGGAYLRFRQHDTDYVVYTAVSSSWGERSGVVPEKAGKPLRGANCVGKVTSTIGPELFERVGIRHDESAFVLP